MTERTTLLLAAGASRRWGPGPKALAPIGRSTALGRIVESARIAGVVPCRVVVGAHGDAVRDALRDRTDPAVEWVAAPAWRSGRTASIQAGLAGLSADVEVLLWPVDQPFVRPETVRRLLAAAEADELAVWVLPQFGGRGGHPVLLKPPAWRRIFDLAPAAPLRALMASFGPQVRRVPVDDAGVVVNLNTPADMERARRDDRLRWN